MSTGKRNNSNQITLADRLGIALDQVYHNFQSNSSVNSFSQRPVPFGVVAFCYHVRDRGALLQFDPGRVQLDPVDTSQQNLCVPVVGDAVRRVLWYLHFVFDQKIWGPVASDPLV